MTSAATYSHWTDNAGSAVLDLVGRGFVHVFRHPLESAMTLALTIGIGYGAINAMFLQTERHPAPLFMDTASIAHPIDSVATGTTAAARKSIPIPLMRPMQLKVASPVFKKIAVPDNVGNKNVAEMQARLAELGFFTGTVDGYYGPETADAIRRFETAAGLEPVGAMSGEVLAAAESFRSGSVPFPAIQPVFDPTSETQPVPSPADDLIGRIAAGAVDEAPAKTETVPATASTKPAALDPQLVRMVQSGLSRLGFLHAEISGKFDAETARAIREFENYNNFRVTGALTPDLVDVLMAAGAFN
jgi:peptidoglycan hydrolase-like protein with peptidoglycan-binding domain